MTHLWVRAEQRENERRVGLTPEGAAELIKQGLRVTVEVSPDRVIPTQDYANVGCVIAERNAWPEAPEDAIVFGLKELPDDGTPLRHRHIMFGHAFKGQPAGARLLERFRAGGGTLYDLEYLVTPEGRRVAAFGYWAGYAGAAVTLLSLSAQNRGELAAPVGVFKSAEEMASKAATSLRGSTPSVIVIGALGRVGAGASDLCEKAGLTVTKWDMAETAGGGPYPEILDHEVFLNCILAGPQTPVFVPRDAVVAPRKLRAIGDIACDPESAYSPIKVYNRVTTWDAPALRVHDDPPLDVMAIDNLPSLLPRESSEDFAAQLLRHLAQLDRIEEGVWGRARATFDEHMKEVAI